MKIFEWESGAHPKWGREYTHHYIYLERGWVRHHEGRDTDWTCHCYFPLWWSDDDCLDWGTVPSYCSEIPGQRFVDEGSIRRRRFFKRTSQWGGLDI